MRHSHKSTHYMDMYLKAMSRNKRASQTGRGPRGFTLMELALVLLLVTALISAIFTAGERVWDNYAVNRVMQEVMIVVQNVRSNYSNMTPVFGPPVFPLVDITPKLYADGLLPAEMLRPGAAAVYDHALDNSTVGGSFHVYYVRNATLGAVGPYNAFRVVLFGITSEDCIKLLMQAPLSDGSIGIIQVGTGNGVATIWKMAGANNAIIYNGATAIGGQAYTMTMARAAGVPPAAGWCTPVAPATTVDVDFDFKLVN